MQCQTHNHEDNSASQATRHEVFSLPIAGVGRALLKLVLCSQELCQHTVVTGLAHRLIKFVAGEKDDPATPAALDDRINLPSQEIVVRKHFLELQ